MNNKIINNSVKITVSGYVQGVGFRYYIARIAHNLNLTGYVKNLYNGNVEIYAEGRDEFLDELIKNAKLGPSHSHVEDIRVEWAKPDAGEKDTSSGLDFNKKYNNFEIR